MAQAGKARTDCFNGARYMWLC